jgi:hypothetical protein
LLIVITTDFVITGSKEEVRSTDRPEKQEVENNWWWLLLMLADSLPDDNIA